MSKQSFEDRLERLSTIVNDLEDGELPLEEGVALYKEGLALAKSCSAQLEAARNEVKVVSEEGLVDLDDEDEDKS
ncbi:MAG: exodeoxyribonuclease VII small subunit [Proteobacteria bacterium]|nr:exodeoxyribonuclease VII small subunit [Pseudomonadota bacterium]MBU1612589.1 exodeoxyribonuclease VII small subunit [Pseudomonadota bacterium]